MKEKIEWVSIIRGITIMLVVIYHVQLVDMSTGCNHRFCEMIPQVYLPFFMPVFFFISGGLVYKSRILRDCGTIEFYKDKFVRILLPFIFFVTVYFSIKMLFNSMVKTPAELSFIYYLKSFVYYTDYPSKPLWFLPTLATMMLLYPIYKYACERDIRIIVLLVLTVAFYYVDLSYIPNVFNIDELNKYLVFFCLGIVFFQKEMYNYFTSVKTLILSALLYGIVYCTELSLLKSLIGVLLTVNIGFMLEKNGIATRIFTLFNDYLLQIYLMSMIFQGFVELVLWKKLFYNETFVYVFYAVNIISGLFIPIIITKIIKKVPIKFIRLCFGLK